MERYETPFKVGELVEVRGGYIGPVKPGSVGVVVNVQINGGVNGFDVALVYWEGSHHYFATSELKSIKQE